MRKNIKVTEGIFPMPVLMIATYNEDGTINVMNAAWGTMYERDQVILNLTESHKTVKNIKERKAFTVSIADSKHVKEADYFGVVSGNNTPNKFEKSGLTSTKSEHVDAPIINEFPLCLECEFMEYNNYGVLGKVVNTTADEAVMNGEKVDISMEDMIKQFPMWFDAWKHSEDKDCNSKYRYLYMGFGNGLCVDNSIYDEFEPYLNELVGSYFGRHKDEDKDVLKYAAVFDVWEEAFINMADDRDYVLKNDYRRK